MAQKNYNEFIDHHIKRKEEIIEFLSQEDRWYHLIELKTNLNWSINTLRKDIQILQDYLPNKWEIKTKRGYGVRLIKPINSSIEDIIYNIRNQSSFYKILFHILNHKNVTLSSLSSKLNYSYYTTKQVLKKIENFTKRYDLHLKKRPLQIKGEEWLIRKCIVDVYLKIYGQNWPFYYYESKQIHYFIEMFEKNWNITFFQNDKHLLSCILAVTISRIKTNNPIYIDSEDYNILKDTLYYKTCKKIISPLEKETNISFSTNEMIYFTIHLIVAKYWSANYNLSKNNEQKQIQEETIDLDKKVKCFLSNLEKTLQIPILQNNEFINHVTMCIQRVFYLSRIHSLNKFSSSLNNNFSDTNTYYIKKKFPNTFSKVKKQFELLFTCYKFCIPEEEIALISLLIESVRGYVEQKSIKLLLYVTDSGILFYLRLWLKKYFPHQFEIIIFTQSLSCLSKFTKENNIALIITNLTISIRKSIPIIKIFNLPTKRDYISIIKFIEHTNQNNT
ncbi:PRD domain-containing protein [Bacillus thuringiensis]|nr:PRD domain-containing protein [Bacillus cereus]MRB05786.1 PRD domain-containing protein [Bacillus thuringiensis]MRC49796.1 PRD domain-containing protein [Bacillus thuringiensis]